MLNNNNLKMYVIKRDNSIEEVYFDKIKKRLDILVNMEPKLESVNIHELTQKVIASLTNNIKTSDIDNYMSECAINMSISNYQYQDLASRIVINNHHKNTMN